MSRVRTIAPLVAAAALMGLAGCSSNSNQQAAAMPPAAPPPAPAPAPPPAPMANPMAPSTLRQVQTALKHDGLYKGRVDGRWGPHTERAVMAFQQKNSLQASGQLDQPTLAALNIGGGEPMGGSGGAPAPSGTSNP